MIKLQLALDFTNLHQALQVLEEVRQWVDVVEIGTPLIKAEGMAAVAEIKKAVPDKWIVADMKTMDAGELEANLAFNAGADLVTVLGTASDVTIRAAVSTAEQRGKKIVIDLIGVEDKISRIHHLEAFGVHYLGVHSGYDDQSQGADPLKDLEYLSVKTSVPMVVAGGIGLQNITQIAKCKPAIIVVGSKITASEKPGETAKEIYRTLQEVQITR